MSDAALGCLLGGALGDAVGGPYENRKPPFPVELDPGRWRLSDDTQLTLATCEAIIAAGKVEPSVIAGTFAEWHRGRRFTGLGASTLKALEELAAGGHWALVGAKGERAAGSGAAMRIAPLAFFCAPREEDARRTIRDVCRITHHNDEAYVGALAVIIAVRAAASGSWPRDPGLIETVITGLPDSGVRDRLRELGALRTTTIAEIGRRFGSSGHVVETVPLALAAAERMGAGFERVLADVVACGGDTDTIASIAGQVMGPAVGKAGLPEAWVAWLEREQASSVALAQRFAAIAPSLAAG
jgi:ADP-ribosylglycohydrolase